MMKVAMKIMIDLQLIHYVIFMIIALLLSQLVPITGAKNSILVQRSQLTFLIFFGEIVRNISQIVPVQGDTSLW